MYDFLVLAPHNCASHSIFHYLNQHPAMHVAHPFVIAQANSPQKVPIYESYVRPWIPRVGIGVKNYESLPQCSAILGATGRDLCVHTVRDPVESFVSLINHSLLFSTFGVSLGQPGQELDLPAQIDEAVRRYITPHTAARNFRLAEFKRRIVIDVSELKGGGVSAVIRRLWRDIAGSDGPSDAAFLPIGSKPYHALRQLSWYRAAFDDRVLTVYPVFEGDPMIGTFKLDSRTFVGRETAFFRVGNAIEVLPAFEVARPLLACLDPSDWYGIVPELRPHVGRALAHQFLKNMHKVNAAYEIAKRAMTFEIGDLSTAEADQLRAGIRSDFEAFRADYPAIADAWVETRRFLGA